MASNPYKAANETQWTPPLVDEHGAPLPRMRPSNDQGNPYDMGSHSGGGGAMRLTLPDLRWNVALLNGAAILFMAALVGMFLWMIDRIDDSFDKTGDQITVVSNQVQDLRVASAVQSTDIKMILEKLSDDAQRSPREGQARPVHR